MRKKVMIIILISIILLAGGLTYAYFLAVLEGTENPTTIQGTVASDMDLELVTENNGYINASNVIPITQDQVDIYAERGEFKVVSGDNAKGVNYTVSLTDITLPAELKNQYFKWRLICTSCADTSKNAEGNFASATTELSLKANIFIPPNSSDTYNLLIWLEDAPVDQTNTMNKTFNAKVQIEGEYALTRVPQEYQEVEYIQSIGTQYIDTEIAPSDIIPIVNIKFMANEDSTNRGEKGIFGAYGANNTRFQIHENSIGIGTYITKYWYKNTLYEIVLNGKNASASINGDTETNGYTSENGFSTYRMFIFTRNNQGNADGILNMQLYYLKIWDDSDIIRNYIPVKRINDNIVGLYDTVEQKFYTNADSSGDNFIAGPNV